MITWLGEQSLEMLKDINVHLYNYFKIIKYDDANKWWWKFTEEHSIKLNYYFWTLNITCLFKLIERGEEGVIGCILMSITHKSNIFYYLINQFLKFITSLKQSFKEIGNTPNFTFKILLFLAHFRFSLHCVNNF